MSGPMSLFRRRTVLIGLLLCLELAGLAIAYQVLTSFECQATGAGEACRLLRSLVARAMSVLAAFAIFAVARPDGFGFLARRIELPLAANPWFLLHVVGIVLMFAPLSMAGGDMGGFFALALGPWVLGAAAASAGALLWLAPPGAWLAWLRAERFAPLAVLATGFVIPDLAELALPLWDLGLLTRLTFEAVRFTLDLVGTATVSDPGDYVIGMDSFLVRVARQCSGVEGFALVTGFTVLYGILFRTQIRLPHFWLVVLPLGLALSWAVNILRISALIWIGARISPELAVNGFHSYAGWMFFTLLALSLLYLVHATPWLHAEGLRPVAPPLRDDPNAALILPFVALMAASVGASALFPHPDLGYPLKAFAMAAALAIFARTYRRLAWSPDPVAAGAGLLVGMVWIALAPPAGAQDAILAGALAELGALSFALWLAARLLGTVLLVPVVEELFFRGYVLGRLEGIAGRAGAVALSSVLFAMLHGRWIEAGLAGTVFALVLLRRGRLGDAIVAHVAANLVIALWAVARSDWPAL